MKTSKSRRARRRRGASSPRSLASPGRYASRYTVDERGVVTFQRAPRRGGT